MSTTSSRVWGGLVWKQLHYVNCVSVKWSLTSLPEQHTHNQTPGPGSLWSLTSPAKPNLGHHGQPHDHQPDLGYHVLPSSFLIIRPGSSWSTHIHLGHQTYHGRPHPNHHHQTWVIMAIHITTKTRPGSSWPTTPPQFLDKEDQSSPGPSFPSDSSTYF